MRQLLPVPIDDVAPYDVYGVDQPARLVRINMVSSVDGRVTDSDGRAGGIGGDGDWEVYRALRALCDAVLVGAGTARIEGYGPHRLTKQLAELRRADGLEAPAAIVLVSRSLQLDTSTPLFTEAKTPTMVLTCASSPADRRRALERHGPVIVAGDGDVDLADGLRQLADDHGLTHVLCEGGPSLNSAMLAARVVDELCITFAPLVTGDDGHRIVAPPAVGVRLAPLSVCEQDGELYVRYAVLGR